MYHTDLVLTSSVRSESDTVRLLIKRSMEAVRAAAASDPGGRWAESAWGVSLAWGVFEVGSVGVAVPSLRGSSSSSECSVPRLPDIPSLLMACVLHRFLPTLGYSWESLRQGTHNRNSRKPGGAFMRAEAQSAALATA